MDFIWVFGLVILGATVMLDIMCTNIIKSSQIHNQAQKRKLYAIVWGVPVLGIFISIMRINRDIKLNSKKMEESIAPAIREIADRIKGLEADLQNQRPTYQQQNKRLH